MALLLAKGDDFSSWRGAEEFATIYREAAVTLASREQPERVARLLEQLEALLDGVAQENTVMQQALGQLLEQLPQADSPQELQALLASFYKQAQHHAGLFQSPVALFSVTTVLLPVVSACCVRLAKQQVAAALPPVALIAMGPAGRHEATRYCRLQLALVWDGEASDELMAQFGAQLLHCFSYGGVLFEEAVTPLQPAWRGSLQQWQARFEAAATNHEQHLLIELLRLADRSVLFDEGALADRFNALCLEQLSQHGFVGNLVERCQLLSNGIGMMGSLRLQKHGPHRGTFPLLDHGFLPLAAAVAAVCLIHRVQAVGTSNRLRELVRVGKLDVKLAERTLQAWHCLNGYRLALEQNAQPGQDCHDILHLAPTTLEPADVERLRASLETVADFQRYLQICYGAYA